MGTSTSFPTVPWDARACRSRASGWAPGPWAAMAGRWAGAAGRCRFHRRDPAGGGPGHQLDRYSGGLRPGPFRRDRAPRAGADGAVRAPLRVHQVRPDWSDAQPQATPRRTGAPASIRREVEDSLRRLGVERIDLYQMHWPAGDGTSLDGYWETLLALKREGKVGAVGLSNHNLAQLQDAEALGHVDSLQPPFSAIQRSAAADLIPWCEAHGTGVIVYSPMQSGLLSGGFSEARAASCPPMTGVRAMPSSGRPRCNAIWHWRRLSGRSPSVTGDGRRRRGGLDPPAGRDRCDRRRAQRGAGGRLLGAAELELDDEDMARIADAIERTGAGQGPSRPSATSRPCPTICSARVG